MPYAPIVVRLERFMRREMALSAREWIECRILTGMLFFKLCSLCFLHALLVMCVEQEDLYDEE